MCVGVYVDHNVRREIVEGLRARGIDCLTAAEDDHNKADDEPLMVRASALDRLTFTMDTDLIEIASRWVTSGKSFRAVIYAHQLGVSIGRAISDVELLIGASFDHELRDRVIWLPL